MMEFGLLYNLILRTNAVKYLLIVSQNHYNTILQNLDFQGIHKGKRYKLRNDRSFRDNEFAITTYPGDNTIKFNSIDDLDDYISRLEKLKVMI